MCEWTDGCWYYTDQMEGHKARELETVRWLNNKPKVYYHIWIYSAKVSKFIGFLCTLTRLRFAQRLPDISLAFVH